MNQHAQHVAVNSNIEQVVEELGYIPPVLTALLAEYNFNLVSHIRLATLRHHGFPDRRDGQRMIASRLVRYATRPGRGGSSANLKAEVFGVGTPGDDDLRLFEFGGPVTGKSPMAVPIMKGLNKRGIKTERFMQLLAARKLDLIHRRGKQPLLVLRERRKSTVFGVVTRQRFQRPLLGFFREARRVIGQHQEEYQDAIRRALSERGRRSLETKLKGYSASRDASQRTLRKLLSQGVDRIAAEKEAARVARSVAAELRAQRRASR